MKFRIFYLYNIFHDKQNNFYRYEYDKKYRNVDIELEFQLNLN